MEQAPIRKIIHIDMDAFYASIEQRDHPEYRGKPVAVGRPGLRGVVATASYEARRFGIRSAMPSVKAARLCPSLIFVPNRMEVYKQISRQIREIFSRYTDLIEPLSLDEAFLDVTSNKLDIPLAVDIARLIKQDIFNETGLTSSAGVSYNKFLAKIASDYRKPNGLCTIAPQKAQEFIDALPIEAFWGVGKMTAARMRSFSITNGKELRSQTKEFLTTHFGKMGNLYYQFARGIDERPVETAHVRKSVGCEYTYMSNLSREEAIDNKLESIVMELQHRLKRSQFVGNTITVKVKFPDFIQKTRSLTMNYPLTDSDEILSLATTLLESIEPHQAPLRLLGVSISNPPSQGSTSRWEQLELPFDPFPQGTKTDRFARPWADL